ncbi:MAG TPA: flagellar motor switch protein FliG [Clostridiales bacterium]|nr:flagellar motor switch protein FliG [Clostridiales bacterium]
MSPKVEKSDALRKAATVVVSLGVETASEVFKYLHEDEIEKLTTAIATMPALSADVVEATMEEFYNLCLAQTYVTEGGIEYARAILEKSLGVAAATAILNKIAKALQVKAFDFIYKVDPKQLLVILQNEHPQTIALILSYCSPDQAAAILSELPRDVQIDVVERVAKMDSTSPEIVRDVEKLIERKLLMSESVDMTEIGGKKFIATVLNSTDRGTEKFIMEELSKKDPALSEEIRNCMFVFEDIALLDPIDIQKLLQNIDINDLTIALKGASKEIAEAFYENMSVRMRETVEEETKYLRGVRLSDVEDRQQKIVNIARKLADAGEIHIVRGRKDDIIV